MINLSWFAAPILAQRNIELHSIDLAFDEANMATVYTVREATGKIGTFSIPTLVLAGAVEKKTVDDLLRPLFETVEFSDGKPVIPEVQPVAGPEETHDDNTGVVEEPIIPDGTTEPGEAVERSEETPAKPTRKRQRTRPPTSETGE
jgi:hypothetical protein